MSIFDFNRDIIMLDSLRVLKDIRNLKLGVYVLRIWWIFDAITEHRKLVYGKLIVTCVRLGFLASSSRLALFGFGSKLRFISLIFLYTL